MYYDLPFENMYGEKFDWIGICHLTDSKVVHAWVMFHRPLGSSPLMIAVGRPTGNDLCYSGIHWAQPPSRRRFVAGRDTSEVTCKKCLRIMNRTAVMKEAMWEV